MGHVKRRYYFNVRNSFGYLKDDEGADCTSLPAARRNAIRAIRSLLTEELSEGRMDLRGHIEVTDASHDRVLLIPFSDAVDLRIGPPPEDRATEKDRP